MVTICPNCERTVPRDEPEAVRFCMYCGFQLASSAGRASSATPPAETQFYLPDPEVSVQPAVPPARATAVPAQVAGHRLVRLLGSGGMGTVYEAESRDSGRRVAVKILSGRLAANPSSVERFRQEGRVASQISHPRCVFVLGADAEAGRPFIVMELMPGQTLKDRVDRAGPLTIAEAMARILDVIDGLAEAHRLGVIHRDVKPSNCFLTADDRVKVGDFGLSKSLVATPEDDDEASVSDPTRDFAARNLTTSGAFLGTVMYASPEQIRGEAVGYDSDVYAVAATLYFLLAGRAPFQHESLTASLARAVSEPPPSLRPVRADVPRELDYVVRRGLERDRSRRYPNLETFRDALVELRPETQRPARLGALVLAYVCDGFLIQMTILPIDVIWQTAVLPADAGALLTGVPGLVTSLVYFTLFEGLTGATPGKRLLRLRVVRLGTIAPPGVARAFGRAVVWTLMWSLVWSFPELVGQLLRGKLGATVMGVMALTGLGLLAVQLRRTPRGHRGMHDRATGCVVVERARPPYRPILKPRLAHPFDRDWPKGQGPAAIGGLSVYGRLTTLPLGSEVYLANDKALGRQALVHVHAPGSPEELVRELELSRPTRLRIIGRGRVAWPADDGTVELKCYTALVAPAGTPLLDLSSPDRPLTWAEARPILEQLVDEFVTAGADGTTLTATVAQVWVEPNGRPQLADFPLPYSRAAATVPPPAAPLDLVRQVATLALEGEARTTPGAVRAALPLHASRITDRLLAPARGYRSLDELRFDLIEDSTRPAAVTSSLRRTHLGVWIPLAAPGLVLMFLVSGFWNLLLTASYDRGSHDFEAVERVVRSAEARAGLVAALEAQPRRNQPVLRMLEPDELPRTLGRIDRRIGSNRETEARFRARLNRVEAFVVDRLFAPGDGDPAATLPPDAVATRLRQLDRGPRATPEDQSVELAAAAFLVATPPATWVALAFLWRGGFALSVAGIAHVRSNGRRAGRLRVAARELLVWSPVTAWLLANIVVQMYFPEAVAMRTVLWLGGVTTLAVWLVLALRFPARPPQDRILGTVLVPR